MKRRVVLFYATPSDPPTIYADGDVEVISVCEYAPNDRSYRMSPAPIPDGLVDAEVGHFDDGSPAKVRALRALAEWEGRSHLVAVSPEEPHDA